MADYTDAHRMFLQILTSRRVLTGVDVKTAYQRSCEKYNVESDSLQTFVLKINNNLEKIHLSIKKIIQEEDEKDTQCFVIVNNMKSEPFKALNTYTPVEREFIKRIIEVIALSPEGKTSEITALNLGLELERKIQCGDCEAIINRLIEGNWLLRINGNIHFSGLMTAEGIHFLEEHCGIQCNKCFFCAMVTYKGFWCSDCDKWFHRSCTKNYWKRSKTTETICPSCRTEWDDEIMSAAKKARMCM